MEARRSERGIPTTHGPTRSWWPRLLLTAGLCVGFVAFVSARPSRAQDPGIPLVAVGDMAVCEGSAPAQVSALLDSLDGDIVGLGDLAYPDGTPGDFSDCFDPVFGRHLARFLPVVGNHEYHTPGAAGFAGYFGSRAGPNGLFYYAEQRGNWQLIVLNSNCSEVDCGEGSIQYQWLEQQLAAAPADTCRAVAMHHPRWSSYPPYASQSFLDPMVRLLHESGTDLLLSGHAHHYERFEQQDPDQNLDPASGFHQFVIGTGGVALRTANLTADNSAVRIQRHGALSLLLEPDGFSWQFVATDASVLDSGSDICVNGAGSTPSTSQPTTTEPTTTEPTTTRPPADPQLFRLYRAVFLRDPDTGGMAFWVAERSGGRSLARIADYFAASPEFGTRYGQLSDDEFVDLVYQNVLGRSPDSTGRAFWISQLRSGMTRGELVLQFSDSQEFIAAVGV